MTGSPGSTMMGGDTPSVCPFCNSAGKRYLYTAGDIVNDHSKMVFDLYECDGCGVISYLPELTGEQLVASYPPDYAKKTFSTGGWGPPQLYRLYKYWSFRRQIGRPAKGTAFLDVGCARGDLLLSMKRRGAAVAGIEINPEDAAFLTAKGIPVFPSVAAVQANSDLRFDAVVMSHVIEHLTDPRLELRTIHSVMKPGGRLIIVTPNGNSLGRAVFGRFWRAHHVPQHIYVFNKHNLSNLLTGTGFSMVAVTDVVAPNVLQESTGDVFRLSGNRLLRRLIAPLFTLNNALFLAFFYMPAVCTALSGRSDIIMAVAEKPESA